jgi:3-oxoacyl-[acyl-carrier protein] reductase
MKFRNKVALVTGASRGIGRAIALALAKEGADVVLNCSTSVKAAEKVSQEINRMRRRVMVIQADVSSKSAVENMIQRVVEELGKIDILVNNAGMSVVGPSSELEEDKWRRGIDVMLTGVFFCSQVAGNEMINYQYSLN